MPTRAKRPCGRPGCPELVEVGATYCDQHKRERTRQYDQHWRDKRTHDYYGSAAWKKLRKMAMAEHGGLCQLCLADGVVRAAEVVHHLDELRKQASLGASLDRLQPLCRECHERIHDRLGQAAARGGAVQKSERNA